LPPLERKSTIKVRPKLGPYESTIRAWLTEDLKVPKKQRHSATRVWQRTIDECGADVSVSAVRVMVRELKAEIIEPAATAMIPQVYLPGRTAEVDFCDVWVIVGGAKLRAKMFGLAHQMGH